MKMLQELQLHQQAQGLLRQALPWTQGRDGVEMNHMEAELSHSIHQHRYKPVYQKCSSAPQVPPANSSNPALSAPSELSCLP